VADRYMLVPILGDLYQGFKVTVYLQVKYLKDGLIGTKLL